MSNQMNKEVEPSHSSRNHVAFPPLHTNGDTSGLEPSTIGNSFGKECNWLGKGDNIFRSLGCSGYRLFTKLSEEYEQKIIVGAEEFLQSYWGATITAEYLENFKIQLERHRKIMVEYQTSRLPSNMSDEAQKFTNICKFILGKSPTEQIKLLPDYVLLELIHNHNYVFECQYNEIVNRDDRRPNAFETATVGIKEYSVNSDKLFRIRKACSIACPKHANNCFDDKKKCKYCLEEIYKRRVTTLRVVTSMYLCPMISQYNIHFEDTIKNKRTGLTDSALLCLTGYQYANLNRKPVGITREDNVQSPLNIYDCPPKIESLCERISFTLNAVHQKNKALLADPTIPGKSKRLRSNRLLRVDAIAIEDWKAWLLLQQNPNTPSSNDDQIDPPTIHPGPVNTNDDDPKHSNQEHPQVSVHNKSQSVLDDTTTQEMNKPVILSTPPSTCGNINQPSNHRAGDDSNADDDTDHDNHQESAHNKSLLPSAASTNNPVHDMVSNGCSSPINQAANSICDSEQNCQSKVTALSDPHETVSNKPDNVNLAQSKAQPKTPTKFMGRKRRLNRRRSIGKKRLKICAKAMGSRVTVDLPTDADGHDDSSLNSEITMNSQEVSSSDTEAESSKDTPPTINVFSPCEYADLQAPHYAYHPELRGENEKKAYKGFLHLCNLRKRRFQRNNMYNTKESMSRFTTKLFEKVFGAKPDEEEMTIAKSILKRFKEDDNQSNPFVGTKDNAFSKEIVDLVLKIAREKKFLPAKAGSYIRAATTDPCGGYRVPLFPPDSQYSDCDNMTPKMRIGQREDGAARVYEAVEASEEERYLLQKVNEFLHELTNGTVPCDHNMMMTVISTKSYSFGAHSDHSIWHGQYGDDCPYLSANGIPLPTEQESHTLTMCITGVRNSKEHVKVSWYDKTKADQYNPMGELLYECITTSNYLHYQGSGSQTNGIVHAGSSVANPNYKKDGDIELHADELDLDSADWRIVISFRQNVSASSCPACYLKRFDALGMSKCHFIGNQNEWKVGIIQAIENGIEPDDYIQESPPDKLPLPRVKDITTVTNKGEERTKYYLNHANNRDQYKNCAHELVRSMGIPIQETYICELPCLADCYMNSDFAIPQLQRGIVSRITYPTVDSKLYLSSKVPKNKEIKEESIPIFLHTIRGQKQGREYFFRDNVYPLDPVLRASSIHWDKKGSQQQDLKPPMLTDDCRRCNAVILHRAYKTLLEPFVRYFSDERCRWVIFPGSGGAPSKMDRGGADWESVLEDEQDIAHTPHAQPLNDMNMTLVEAAIHKRPIAVFLAKEAYDYIWSKPAMQNQTLQKRKVIVGKQSVYFVGYMTAIASTNSQELTHEQLKELLINETIENQKYMRFREMPYFRLTMELIPDSYLRILPVRDKSNKDMLVHHGPRLKEVNIKYDPNQRIRIPADRRFKSQYLALGSNNMQSKGRKKKNQPDECTIHPISRHDIVAHHLNTTLHRESNQCRDVITSSKHVAVDQLPQPLFKKIFSSKLSLQDYEFIKDLERRIGHKDPVMFKAVLKLAELDDITSDDDIINFKCFDDTSSSTNEAANQQKKNKKISRNCLGNKESDNVDAIENQDLLQENKDKDESVESITRTKDEMVKVEELADSMVFVSAAVLYRASKVHITEDGYCTPLSNRSLGSKLQLYPTKSPNSILDFGRYMLRNDILNRLPSRTRDRCNFKTFKVNKIDDPLLIDCCFKSLLLTFIGRPSVVSNYYLHVKGCRGSCLPTADDINNFLDHLGKNREHGTSDGGIYNQQWTICTQLKHFSKFKDFITDYATIHNKKFYNEVIQPSIDKNGIPVRKKVLDRWVSFAATCRTNGASTTLKFRFHIHQAMLNIENVFGRVFGDETLDSVCVYHGSKEGWNKLRIRDELQAMNSQLSKCHSKRVVKLDDDKICSMADLMTQQEYDHFMKYFSNLSNDKLAVILLEKDKNGNIRNKVNGLTLGPSFLEHTLCILQYYLRKFSSGYNISSSNDFDRPNFQPLKFSVQFLALSEDSDKYLWKCIQEGIKSFERIAGHGKTWHDISWYPPSIFLIREEKEMINSPPFRDEKNADCNSTAIQTENMFTRNRGSKKVG